ncbi:MAG: RNA polymerase sigma-54 factor [Acidobacteria bacterium]|nr:MAG: RNA polymerase sigma-54 factor [Acidobacteriota bacterium]
MSVKPHLSTSLSQRLVLTPQMRQRIELLAMTKLELADMVQTELSANPVLDEVAPGEGVDDNSPLADEIAAVDATTADITSPGEMTTPQSPAPDGGVMEPSSPGEAPSVSDISEVSTSTIESIPVEGEAEPERERDPFDEVDFGSTFEEYLDPGYKTHEYEAKDDVSFENMLTRRDSLCEQLIWQLHLTGASDEIRAAGEAIIGNLDENTGFLDATIEEIAAMGPWEIGIVEQAIAVVQRLDPVGCAARDVRESLLIQLDFYGYGDRLAAQMVRDHLESLQTHKLPELTKALGVPLEQVLEEMEIIKKLDPKPGRKYSSDEAQPVVPEVSIEKIGEDYFIRFEDDGLPHLRINRTYRQMMESKDSSKETRDYIKERFRSAVDLLKNIEHRRQTIYRVCHSIVDRQRDFLDHGIEHLKPMMLKDIAEDIGMHLSTVSRVVNRKYVNTPQGVYELRRFFTEGMRSDTGEDVSTRVLKLKIKKMIEMEDPHHPITDDEVAKRLARDGVKMSRRTVAKYRDQMRIPGSRERRAIV